MYFKIGDHRCDDNTTDVSTQKSYSYLKGKEDILTCSMNITGSVYGDTQAKIKAAMKKVQDAFGNTEVNSAGLYHDNGTPSLHVLSGSDTINGIEVSFGWVSTGGGEYATKRSFTATLQTQTKVQGEDQLVSFSESIATTGTGGPKKAVTLLVEGPPDRQTVAQQTPIRVVQSGSAQGRTQMPSAPGPIHGADAEELDLRSMTPGRSLDSETGDILANSISWSYTFTLI